MGEALPKSVWRNGKPDWVDRDAAGLPLEIDQHPDPCDCPRCKGFEQCYVCGRIKLDIDWCWAERRLVL